MHSFHPTRQDTSGLFEVIDDTAQQLDDAVNVFFGSMFRTGTATSFFASQTARYADLYAPTFLSLIKCVNIRYVARWVLVICTCSGGP